MKEYNEEDFLMLSGIQHYRFCKRQWALIHVENEWAENVLTVEGQHLHKKADQPLIREKRKDKLIVRGLPVHSRELGISGICDVVEFIRQAEGIHLANEEGYYLPVPVEYKRGKPKKDRSDWLQLAAQAMCLEEMLACTISKAYLFYNEVKHREEVMITEELRNEVVETFADMHQLLMKRHTPKVKTGTHCKSCSLRHICLPELMDKRTVTSYLNARLAE